MGFNGNYFKNTNNIFNLKLKPNQFTILTYLIRMANESENCYPSMNNIAEMCCVSKSTVVRTIEELEEAGFINVNIDNKFNIYVINYDVIENTNNRPKKTKKERKKSSKTSIKNTPVDSNGEMPLEGQITVEEVLQVKEKTDIEIIVEATGCNVERAKEVLEYAVACNKNNPVGFSIKAINEGWKLENKETNGVNPRSFNNFEGRTYNYDTLELMLLGYVEYNDDDIHNVLSGSNVAV